MTAINGDYSQNCYREHNLYSCVDTVLFTNIRVYSVLCFKLLP